MTSTPASAPHPVAAESGPARSRATIELSDVSVMIGGQGGDGTLTVSDLLGRYFRKRGLYVYTSRNVLSRIRGGHADASVRGARDPISAVKSHVDVLVAFDAQAIEMGREEMAPHGFVIYDSTAFRTEVPNSAGFPFATLVGGALGQPIFKNTAAYGALSVLLGFDPDVTRSVIEERFRRRGGEALEKNLKALEIGRKAALETEGVPHRFSIVEGDAHDLVLTTGNQAVALGFAVGGGRFFAGYPITPATEIMEYLQRYLPPLDGVVRQAEDELAAINMVIGAGYAGVRAMTSTSGPGLSLMTEGIGQAGTAEIPVVVADCARVGPSTGQPTRHEQSDLSHLANLGHGEYPRFLLAPADPEDAFGMTVDALNLAERWRLPVLLLLDQALCQNTTTSRRFSLAKVAIDRGRRLTPEAVAKLAQYKVYEFSDDGRSPYAPPGTPGIWAEVTGNEHDEWGHVSVDPVNRGRMMKKRMEKMIHARAELPASRRFGPPGSKIGLIGFGSTSGPILEAQRVLAARGVPTLYLQARTLFPVPVHEIDPFLKEVDVAYVVEHNYTGQFARLLRETMPWQYGKIRSILKYDGYSFRAPQIIAGIREVA
ncbi:MAG TPA: 2-oxoacid:acceptor oxidoreductase subunit alpha [Thermoplasmata archaeon]|nr:2-oxoacid:acceptor oxidoreductase subunit alpha [Thermoplasmata archaeon]